MNTINWAAEFAQIISCTRCTTVTCKKILRDSQENIPQPGFIGPRFAERRVLLVGQNPGVATSKSASDDRQYTAALRAVRDNPSSESLKQLQETLRRFVPTWPVHGSYFPLQESGLTLNEIAYCNITRCRTEGNAKPSRYMADECAEAHFKRWLDLLRPRVVVFIGKWAYDQGAALVHDRQIPCDYMNRWRSLPSEARVENRRRIAALINDRTK